MRWRVVIASLVLSAPLMAMEPTVEDLSRILNEVAKIKEQIMNERAEILSRPSKNFERKLKEINSQLKLVESVEKTVEEYRKRIQEGAETVSPPSIKKTGDIGSALSSLLREDVDGDIAYAGKEGTVFSFSGGKGYVFVYGEVREVPYYDEYGERDEKEEFFPKWGVYVEKRTEVLAGKDGDTCYYTGNITFETPREKCPLSLSIEGIGDIKTDGESIYGSIRVGVIDPSFEKKGVAWITLFGKISPEGNGVYLGTWEKRFFLYTLPSISISIGNVYMDREKIDFVNELIRERMREER